ncbi:MAG: hypothetical protein AB8B91_03250 [Rubripirellula sp.]
MDRETYFEPLHLTAQQPISQPTLVQPSNAANLEMPRRLFHQIETAGELKMTYVMVDIESDGPIPGDYSMVCFGAVIVEPGLSRSFYGQMRPVSDRFVQEALAVSGFSRSDCLGFDEPQPVMERFAKWLGENCKTRPMFVSDNNGFDWQFINWYFHHFTEANPFGFSSTNLGSLYKGMQKDVFTSFKHLRKTAHTHHPVDDAIGNAEAMLGMKEMGLKVRFD